jgi:hypothetical protein
LKLYNGSQFQSIGINDYGNQFPIGSNPGDLHFNSITQILYAYNGSEWLPIGPSPSLEGENALNVLTVNDTIPVPHLVIQAATNTSTIFLASSDPLFQVQTSSGVFNKFPQLYPGINLPATNTSGVSAYYNGTSYVGNLLWGTSASAIGLIDQGGNYFYGTDVLRRSVISTGTNLPIILLNDNGITVGLNKVVQMHVTNSTEANISVINGKKLHLNLNTGFGTYTNIITIDGTSGIKVIPNSALSVSLGSVGNVYSNLYVGNISVSGSSTSISTTTGAVVVNGGVGIGNNLYVGGTIYGTFAGSIANATSVAGGTSNEILYQSTAGTTSFIPAPVSTGTYLQWTGTNFTWSTAGQTTFSGGSTGLTPTTATNGTIVLGGVLSPSAGGTGASSLTGYLYGNGTSPITANPSIPWTVLSGTPPSITTFPNNAGYLGSSSANSGFVTGQTITLPTVLISQGTYLVSYCSGEYFSLGVGGLYFVTCIGNQVNIVAIVSGDLSVTSTAGGSGTSQIQITNGTGNNRTINANILRLT